MTQIKTVRVDQHTKIVGLTSTLRMTSELRLPRFSPVLPNDDLIVKGTSERRIFLKSADAEGELIPIVPTYRQIETISIGGRSIAVEFSEIDSADKYAAYLDLERFHYRSNPSLLEQEEKTPSAGGGRKAILLASTTFGRRTEYIGYIELGMPLMMVGPRHRAFSRPFNHSIRDVHWVEWNQHSIKQHLNLIVRVSRVVTHPTFRGIGLAKRLLLAAESFSRERWHVQRRRPLFIEISAEMLNHFDFVSGAGYTYCGLTDGNLARVAKDMRSMYRGQKITSGIMTLQNKYFSLLTEFAQLNAISVDDAIKRVEQIASHSSPQTQVDDRSWLLLRKIFRVPRPYFLKGLDEVSERYLRGVDVPPRRPKSSSEQPFDTKIEIKNLEVFADVRLPESANVKVVKDAFGLTGDRVRQKLLDVPCFSARSGSIFLLSGASGTGKSVFLDAIGANDRALFANMEIRHGLFEVPRTAKMAEIPPNSILIDHFSEHYGLSPSLEVLAKVGLSEAIPLVKPFWMLSKGQKYRALVADLVLRRCPVWLLDEFGADLDPITAGVVASKLRTLVTRLGVIAFVAAANNGHFFKALQPNRVLSFDLGAQPRMLLTWEYEDEFFEKA